MIERWLTGSITMDNITNITYSMIPPPFLNDTDSGINQSMASPFFEIPTTSEINTFKTCNVSFTELQLLEIVVRVGVFTMLLIGKKIVFIRDSFLYVTPS